MIKLLHLEIHDTCEKCPYCRWSEICHEWYCDNNYKVSVTSLLKEIPEWCPLQTWVEGDKF
jgi:hypothetical protein